MFLPDIGAYRPRLFAAEQTVKMTAQRREYEIFIKKKKKRFCMYGLITPSGRPPAPGGVGDGKRERKRRKKKKKAKEKKKEHKRFTRNINTRRKRTESLLEEKNDRAGGRRLRHACGAGEAEANAGVFVRVKKKNPFLNYKVGPPPLHMPCTSPTITNIL